MGPRGPRLLASADPCAGFFPGGAQATDGVVDVEVRVDPQGRATATRVLRESPLRQGFGVAARSCAGLLRFAPARSTEGARTEAAARLRLRFHRS